MSILVINAGSSSLKFALFDMGAQKTLASGEVDWAGGTGQAELRFWSPAGGEKRTEVAVSDHRAAVGIALRAFVENNVISQADSGSISAIGHRVVHGGTLFRDTVQIDDQVKAAIADLSELAPLHNPPALEALEATEGSLPGVPQVAVFDTAFFSRLAPGAYIYPLPYEWFAEWGIRRFGFHGISHAYCAARAAELAGQTRKSSAEQLRSIVCHIGNGCSATAIREGVAISTTMGFTPMDGLMMGTRPGSVDPGILMHLQRSCGLSADQVEHALNWSSGLLGVSGVSRDFRQVEEAAKEGNERACLALKIYADRVRAAVGALAVTLKGVDILVFTAGVGENSASFRASVCDGLECLGLQLDARRNAASVPDGDISTVESPARILVIHTQEELMIAREARRVLLPQMKKI